MLRTAVNTVGLYHGDPAYGRVAVLAAARVSDLSGARRLLEDAVNVEETPELRLALAVTALRMNDRVAARENAQRALALSANYKDAADLSLVHRNRYAVASAVLIGRVSV